MYIIHCTCIKLRLQYENKYTYREYRLKYFFFPKPSFENSHGNQMQITDTHNGHSSSSIRVIALSISHCIFILNPLFYESL